MKLFEEQVLRNTKQEIMSYYGSGSQGFTEAQPNFRSGGASEQHSDQSAPFQSGYADPNSWQQQQQNQQQPPYGQHQYLQQPTMKQQQQPFWNPAAAASMAAIAASSLGGATSNEQMLDAAGQFAGSFLQSSSARMIPGLEMTLMVLRQYFAVDNKYVLQKVKRVLAPFLSKQWSRQVG